MPCAASYGLTSMSTRTTIVRQNGVAFPLVGHQEPCLLGIGFNRFYGALEHIMHPVGEDVWNPVKTLVEKKKKSPSHDGPLSGKKLEELVIELRQHSPYSPDLAPTDYNVFWLIRPSFAGRSSLIGRRSKAWSRSSCYSSLQSLSFTKLDLCRKRSNCQYLIEQNGEY